MPSGSTVTSAAFPNFPGGNLKLAICQKCRGLLVAGMSPLHNNVRPYTRAAMSTIEDLQFECIPHPLHYDIGL